MKQLFDVKIPVTASSSTEAGEMQKALLIIGQQFTSKQLTSISSKLRNPLIKAGVLKQLG